jgi:two-component system, cell cycle response regulator
MVRQWRHDGAAKEQYAMPVEITLLALAGPALAFLFLVRSVVRAWRRVRHADRPEQSPARQWAPILLGLSVIAYLAGQASAVYFEDVLHRVPPFPFWTDAGYLGAYPFMLLGVIGLASPRTPLAARARLALDSMIPVAALTAFSWYFVLGPAIFTSHKAFSSTLTVESYAFGDLILIFGAFLLLANWRDSVRRPAIAVLAPALTIIACTDTVSVYQILHGAHADAGLLQIARSLGYILLAFGGCTLVDRIPRSSESAPALLALGVESPSIAMRQVWRLLLPYALIPTVVALMGYMTHTTTSRSVETGVYIVGALLLELILIHQFLAYRELIAYANRSRRLESLAGADPITGLLNHRSLVAALDHELARSQRYGRACSLLFLDLDHFKALNDTFGHQAGDAALHEFSAIVRGALRGTDSLGRWGGEEFVVLLPETGRAEALVVAERIRSGVASHTFWAIGGAHITCSLGFATYPDDAPDRDVLLEVADRAMYAAKRLGRNQVRGVSDPAVLAAQESRVSGPREDAALIGTVETLAALVEARDQYTGQHVDTVAQLSTRLALALGLDASQAQLVGIAGRLHDVGKVAIPDAVLLKPTDLTDEEWALIRTHPGIGAAILTRIPALHGLAPVIRAHHERWDGKGYPDRLSGSVIPLGARILAVADAFSAMTTDRPYHPARDKGNAIAEMRRCSGSQFDPEVVDSLQSILAHDETERARTDVA